MEKLQHSPIVIGEESLGKGIYTAIKPVLPLAQSKGVYMIDVVVSDNVFPLIQLGWQKYIPEDKVMTVDLKILLHQLNGNAISLDATFEVENILALCKDQTKPMFQTNNYTIRDDCKAGGVELYAYPSLTMNHFFTERGLDTHDNLLYGFKEGVENTKVIYNYPQDIEQEFVPMVFDAIKSAKENGRLYIPLIRMYEHNSIHESNLYKGAKQYTQCFYHAITLTTVKQHQFIQQDTKRAEAIYKKTKGFNDFIRLIYSEGKAKITEISSQGVWVTYISDSTTYINLFLTPTIGLMFKSYTYGAGLRAEPEKIAIIYDLQTMSLDECLKNAKPFGLADLFATCDLRTKLTIQDLINARKKKK